MSEQIVQQIKERVRQDPVFREALITSPLQVLQDYALTEEEKQSFVAPNFSWMIEKRLAGVSYPRSEDAIALLHTFGVRVLLNLSEVSVSAALLSRYQMQEEHLPVRDFTAPTLKQAEQAVWIIDCFLERDLPVAVHCRAGLGRTGTILACYLVAHGCSAEEAIQQVRKGRPGSIETREQEAVIQAYEQARQGPYAREAQARQRKVSRIWRLALQTRSGKPRGILHFWPFWERFTGRLWRLQAVPGSAHELLMLRFTRYRGKPLDLPDGTHVERGDHVGILHFHNQALLQFTKQIGPWEVLKWMGDDMRALASWQRVADLKAIYGLTLLSRAAPRLGFTLRRRPRSIGAWFDRCFMTGLLVLYHTQGLERLTRGTTYGTYPQEAWMSLSQLKQRYGSQQEKVPFQSNRKDLL